MSNYIELTAAGGDSHARTAGRVPAGTLELGWQAHPYWPVIHNAKRALAQLRAGGRPVLLVRGPRQGPYRHALFPTDLSPSSLEGARQAIRSLPPLPQLRLTLLHTCRIGGEGSMRTAGVGDATLEACRRSTERAARAAGHRFVAQLRAGDARAALLMRVVLLRQPWAMTVAAHAGLAQPEVLVLAAARGGMLGEWRWRADLHTLLRRTRCDLLLLPHAVCR